MMQKLQSTLFCLITVAYQFYQMAMHVPLCFLFKTNIPNSQCLIML